MSNRRINIFFSLFVILLFAFCKKDKGVLPVNSADSAYEDLSVCEPLPPQPPTGWVDSTRNPNLNILLGTINSSNPSEIFYVSDDSNTSFILWHYDQVLKTKFKMDSLVLGQTMLNSKGWLVYFKTDWNIYKIKTNGDSLTQLTFDGISQNPSWDYTGNYIYYYRPTGNISTAHCYKMDKSGVAIDSLVDIHCPVYCSKISNNLVYIDIVGGMQRLIYRNLDNNINKVIYQKQLNMNPIGFGFPIIDNTDSFVYWYDANGVYKTEIVTLITTQLLTNCPRLFYNGISLSSNSTRLVLSQRVCTPVNFYLMYNETNLFTSDLNGGNLKQVK